MIIYLMVSKAKKAQRKQRQQQRQQKLQESFNDPQINLSDTPLDLKVGDPPEGTLCGHFPCVRPHVVKSSLATCPVLHCKVSLEI